MRSKYLILVLVFKMITISKSENENCSVYSLPKVQTYIRGHVGYFYQDLSEYPKELDQGQLLTDSLGLIYGYDKKPETLVFNTNLAEPFVFTVNDKDGFTIWGPMYSLIREVALFLNYSLDGINIVDENRYNAAMKHKADLALGPLIAHYKMVATCFDDSNPVFKIMQMIHLENKLSRSFGVAEIDCIMFRKEIKERSLFDFLSILDRNLALLFFVIGLVIALFLSNFKFRNYLFYLKQVLQSLVGIVKKFKSKFYSLFVLWLTVYWFFQQMFGSDLLSQMTKPPKLNVINSWDDLKNRPNLKILATSDFGDLGDQDKIATGNMAWMSKNNYINVKSSYHDDFTRRLKVEMINEIKKSNLYKMEDGEILDMTRFDGNAVLMSVCESLRYRHFNSYCGQLRDRLHASESGGEKLPYFVFVASAAEDVEIEAIDLMVVRLSESGIYEKWLTANTYNLKQSKLKPALFDFQIGHMNNFYGPFSTFLVSQGGAFVLLLLEALMPYLNVFAVKTFIRLVVRKLQLYY